MKRRHFISFVFVLILCIGMIGCGKEKKTTASDKFQSDYMEIGVGTTVEKGYFGVINGLLYYVDFETMNAVPICNKPDCRHISWMEDRNTKCNAANTDIWNLFPYKGKLYGFRSLADGGSELVVSDLDGSNWKSKGMFIKAEESFHEGVVVKDQMFYLKDVALREEEAAEPELETVMCMLDLDTMKSREICRERGTFSIQFLGGTKDYQIYSVKGEDGVTCYQFDYKKEVSKEISLYDIPGRIIGADETGFYYNSGIDYPSAVYRYHFETGENEVFVSKEEAKAAYGKDVFSLSLWDVREEGILFKIWYGEDQRLLSACSSEDKTEKPSSENQLQSDYMEVDGILTKTEKGSFSVHDGLMYFTDYETQTSIPVCGKPNCRHLSVYEDEKTTCNAVCSSSYMFPYKEKLYRIESVDNREGKLIASHMDGSNPKTVGTFSSGDMLESAVILNENMYYTYCELQNKILAEQEDGQAQSGQAMGSNCSLNRLNLDTLEQTEIVKLEDVSHILMLGGTKEYQVCAVVKDDGVQYNLFDYESGTLTEISLNTVDYQRVEVTQDGKGFYYIGDEGKSLYCYHIDSKENEKIVQAEEVGAEKVTVEGVSEEGILFRAFPENELYVKNEEGISNLKLSDRLPTDQAWLSGINDITKDGVYFTYQEKYIGEKEIEGDLLMYDAYIEKEDLFGKTGEMKVIYTPRVSSAGNIVTEE